MKNIPIQQLNEADFAPFGNVIDFNRTPDFAINNGMCDRYHALAETELAGNNGNIAISLGRARPYQLPLKLEMMERHPLGSQAFIPLEPNPFLVIVAADNAGIPDTPQAFLAQPGQGINYHRNVWHAVLTPLDKQTDFVIVDRNGEGNNLEEYFFQTPFLIDK